MDGAFTDFLKVLFWATAIHNFLNDLSNTLRNSNITLYAHDAAIYCAHSCVDNLQSKLNIDLKIVTDWQKVNYLTLNVSKSKFMLIGSSKRLAEIGSVNFQVEEEYLDEVETFTSCELKLTIIFLGNIMFTRLEVKSTESWDYLGVLNTYCHSMRGS